jgi:hypothetical protein
VQGEQEYIFFTVIPVLLDKKNVYRRVQIQIWTRRIHEQLFPPSCTKALEENRNYIEEPRPCASPSRQKPPPLAAVEQLQAAIVEEETMVVADLEAPRRM